MSTMSVDPSKKTVGTTSLAAGGGSILGSAVATIILYFVPDDTRMALFLPVTAVLTTVFALAGGYLSPSKAALIAPYINGLSDQITEQVSMELPDSETIASHVASKVDTEGIAARVAELAPTADVPTREELSSIVKENSGSAPVAANTAPVEPGVIPARGDAGARAPEPVNSDIVASTDPSVAAGVAVHEQVHADQAGGPYPDLDAYAKLGIAESS